MDRETLAAQFQANNHRPAWVMENREALEDHINTSEPIPENGSLYEIRQWLARFKGTVTRQLNDDAESTDPQDEAEAPEADA